MSESYDGEIRDRSSLIDALRSAATLEHDVICRYLFAACTLKSELAEGGLTSVQLESVRDWRTDLLRVAREEMGHMGLVCNLLSAVGATAHFTPPRARSVEAHLLPFSDSSLASFIQIERDHDPESGAGTIGDLYARIRRAFVHLRRDDPRLFIGAPEVQVDNDSIDLPPGWYDFQLHAVRDLEGALRALDQILEESDEREHDSHAEVFVRMRETFSALSTDAGDFRPVRPTAANPSLYEGPGLISHPVSHAMARLFNDAYEVMLMMLLRFYAPGREDAAERYFLHKTAFFPLMTMVLRPLGECLCRVPLSDNSDDRTAGPTFECGTELSLPSHPVAAWTVILERLDGLSTSAEALADRSHALPVGPRIEFIRDNLNQIADAFCRRMNVVPHQVRHVVDQLL